MEKKYVVFQSGRYLKFTSHTTECKINPLEATMFKEYEDALIQRNKFTENSVVPAYIHSISYTVSTENELNDKLIELDNSIKRINEVKLALGCECLKK